MIRIEQATLDLVEVEELGVQTSLGALEGLRRIARMSNEVYRVVDDCDGPLCLVGVFQFSPLSSWEDVWLFAYKNLRAEHLRVCKAAFDRWQEERDRTVWARCDGAVQERFLKFFGFRYRSTDSQGVHLYEAVQ